MFDDVAYEVTPEDSEGRAVGRPVYLRAQSEARARRAGRQMLKALGQRGNFRAVARAYDPLQDAEMGGFVRRVAA